MKQIIYISLFSILISACAEKRLVPEGEVKYAGELRQVMNGNLEPNFKLSDLEGQENLYALGAMEGLSGEILIYNSTPLNSVQAVEMAEMDNTLDKNASVLVYSQVEEWEEYEVPRPILTMKLFETYVEAAAKKAGIDTSKPFPFLLEGYVRKINWHVVNWDPAMGDHSINAHKNSGLNGVAVDQDVKILGFYSSSHQGIFTHHDTNVHMHFSLSNEKLAGHLDDMILGEYMRLKLPKQ